MSAQLIVIVEKIQFELNANRINAANIVGLTQRLIDRASQHRMAFDEVTYMTSACVEQIMALHLLMDVSHLSDAVYNLFSHSILGIEFVEIRKDKQ